MTGSLLDASVLIAALFPEHEHFEVADRWLERQQEFAVCPITEGALVRFALRLGVDGEAVHRLLDELHAAPACTFLADALSYRSLDLSSLTGHRHATDAYLLGLAVSDGRRLATFDRALASAAGERAVVPAI